MEHFPAPVAEDPEQPLVSDGEEELPKGRLLRKRVLLVWRPQVDQARFFPHSIHYIERVTIVIVVHAGQYVTTRWGRQDGGSLDIGQELDGYAGLDIAN